MRGFKIPFILLSAKPGRNPISEPFHGIHIPFIFISAA
jgi:hypothetical protein